MAPWLAGAACTASLALLLNAGASRTVLAALVLAVPLAASRAASPLEPAALAGGLLLVALAAGASAALLARGDADLVARGWWLAAAVSTALALVQYFGVAGALSPLVSPTEAGTAYANLRQRNQFASLMAIGLAALLWETRRGTRLAVVLPSAAWLGLGNAASISRTGLLELIVLALLSLLWPGRSRSQLWVVFCALTAYVAGVLLLPILLSVLTGIAGESLWQRLSHSDACGSRTVLWSNVLHLIGERPFFGWGWGELDYAHYMTLYPGARFCDILDNAHNLPLHLAVELGLPVALVVIGLVTWAVLRARPWREVHSHRQLAWAVLAVIAIHSMLEYPLWSAPFQLACGLAVGLLWPGDIVGTRHAAARLGAPVALAGAVIYAAWDYTRVSQIYLPAEQRLAGYRDDPMFSIRQSWLFRDHARFAELTLTPLTRANAQWTFELARELLHYSPEPRVIERVIESASMLGRRDIAAAMIARFRVAFPKEHAHWVKVQASVSSGADDEESRD